MARVLDLIHNIASASTLLTSKQKQPTKRSPTRKSFRKKSVRRSDKVSSVDNEDYSLNSVCDNVETLEIVTPGFQICSSDSIGPLETFKRRY